MALGTDIHLIKVYFIICLIYILFINSILFYIILKKSTAVPQTYVAIFFVIS